MSHGCTRVVARSNSGKSRYQHTAVPYSALTVELLEKFKDRIKLRQAIATNYHGGRSSNLYIDDGPNNDGKGMSSAQRPVEIEVPDCVSTFGISFMDDLKSGNRTESGEYLGQATISFHLRQNSKLERVAACLDEIARREVLKHRDALFKRDLSSDVILARYVSLAKMPANSESRLKYGPRFQFNLPEKGVRYFDEALNEICRDQMMQMDADGNLLYNTPGRPWGCPGIYTVRFVASRMYFCVNSYNITPKLLRLMHEPDEDEDEPPFVTKPRHCCIGNGQSHVQRNEQCQNQNQLITRNAEGIAIHVRDL